MATFDTSRFIEDVKRASREGDGQRAVEDVLRRAVSEPGAVLAGLGEPKEAGIHPLYQADGVKTACHNFRWVENSGVTAAPAHVLLNLAIGGKNWAGRHGVDATRFPTSMDVDFVRIYARE